MKRTSYDLSTLRTSGKGLLKRESKNRWPYGGNCVSLYWLAAGMKVLTNRQPCGDCTLEKRMASLLRRTSVRSNGVSRASKMFSLDKSNMLAMEKSLIPDFNLLSLYLHKRQDFKHEQEGRAITTTWPKTVDEMNQPSDTCDVGRNYEVDLSLLIKEAIVAPYADDWFLDLIQSVTVHRYGLEVPVVRSDLARKPIWE